MTNAALPYPAHGRAAKGWAALALIVNDAIMQTVTRPDVGSAPVRPMGPDTIDAAADRDAPPKHPAPRMRGRSSRSSRVVPPEAPEPGGTEDVEAGHERVWSLVRAAQAGDGDAYGTLYDEYVDIVFRFVYYRVNDRALAEDFTSETFLRALRRIGTINYQGRDIGAWFITIARNIVLDHVKSARNRLEITTADTIEGREREQSTEAIVLQTLTSERLMEAVAQLGDEQRECVMLRFMQGLSVNETAEIMGKKDGAIKALQHRAVRKLADLVGGDLR